MSYSNPVYSIPSQFILFHLIPTYSNPIYYNLSTVFPPCPFLIQLHHNLFRYRISSLFTFLSTSFLYILSHFYSYSISFLPIPSRSISFFRKQIVFLSLKSAKMVLFKEKGLEFFKLNNNILLYIYKLIFNLSINKTIFVFSVAYKVCGKK